MNEYSEIDDQKELPDDVRRFKCCSVIRKQSCVEPLIDFEIFGCEVKARSLEDLGPDEELVMFELAGGRIESMLLERGSVDADGCFLVRVSSDSESFALVSLPKPTRSGRSRVWVKKSHFVIETAVETDGVSGDVDDMPSEDDSSSDSVYGCSFRWLRCLGVKSGPEWGPDKVLVQFRSFYDGIVGVVVDKESVEMGCFLLVRVIGYPSVCLDDDEAVFVKLPETVSSGLRNKMVYKADLLDVVERKRADEIQVGTENDVLSCSDFDSTKAESTENENFYEGCIVGLRCLSVMQNHRLGWERELVRCSVSPCDGGIIALFLKKGIVKDGLLPVRIVGFIENSVGVVVRLPMPTRCGKNAVRVDREDLVDLGYELDSVDNSVSLTGEWCSNTGKVW